MIQRRTQTEAYWRKQFELTAEDVSRVYDLIMDRGVPVSMEEISLAMIERHCRKEEEIILSELSRGPIYQPKNTYEIGQQILFPALNYSLGTVVDQRPGRNPDFGEFTVIGVEIEKEKKTREFATGLEGAHKLNFEEGSEDLLVEDERMSPTEVYTEYGPLVDDEVEAVLSEDEQFVRFGEQWFLQDLLVPISVGQLNIAEALVEIKSRPLTPREFLADMDVPSEVSEEIQILSLNCALQADKRFDNVGDGGRDIWYLRRLTPKSVVNPPERLVLDVRTYDRDAIDDALRLIEREIDDEGSGEEIMGASRPLYKTSLALSYPHWRSGTLPLTVRTRRLFPEATIHHFPIVLVDGQTGDRMQGWVVHGSSFVFGLEGWYRWHRLPVGAYIKLERTRDPRVITVDFEPRRLKSLWIPVAAVKNGKLVFQMRKTAIACEYDERLTIGEDSPEKVDELWREVKESGESLFKTMKRIMPELTQISPQGTIHAKTIYSAVNVLRRTPPGPIFAVLSSEPCFVSMGGGYWTFDEASA